MSVIALKLRRQPAFIARRAAMDVYFRLSDAAGRVNLDLVSGVNSNGMTFVGVFSERGARLQMTTTEGAEVTTTIDGMPVAGFDRFSVAGRAVIAFMDEFGSSMMSYSELDRCARQSTMTEIVAEYTVGSNQN